MTDMTLHPIQTHRTDEGLAEDNVVALYAIPALMPNERELASHHALEAGKAALGFLSFMTRTESLIQYPELSAAVKLIYSAIRQADEDRRALCDRP
jgi:hypothetical protein